MRDLNNYKDARLKPARNVRRVVPRCCATCKHHLIINGFGLCEREGGYEGDPADGYHLLNVCDLWAK